MTNNLNSNEAEVKEDQDVASLIYIQTLDINQEEIKYVKYQITRLPQHGTLYDRNAPTTPLLRNALLSEMVELNSIEGKTNGVGVLYKSEPGWSSIPDTKSNGTAITPTIEQDYFEYRIVQMDPLWSATVPVPNGVALENVKRVVKVQNSNDAPILTIQPFVSNDENNNQSVNNKKGGGLIVHTFSTLIGEDEACWTAEHVTEDDFCKTKTNLGNITLYDADRDVDRVRVDVRTEKDGMLTMHPEDLELADFNTCSNRNSTNGDDHEEKEWNCVGDGANDPWVSKMRKKEFKNRNKKSDPNTKLISNALYFPFAFYK